MFKRVTRLVGSLVLACLPLLTIDQVSAAVDTCTWTGLGTDNLWSNSDNWGDGAGPITECDGAGIPENGDTISFPSGASRLTNSNDIAGLDLARVDIDGNGYNISGADIDISPSAALGMTINGSNNIFDINTAWNGTSSLSLSGGGDNNEVSGDIVLNLTGGGDMNVGTGAGLTLEFSGIISGNTDGFIVASDGVVVYSRLNTYSAAGAVQINQSATVRCNTASCFGDSGNTVYTYGNAEIILPNPITLPNDINFNAGTNSPARVEAQDTVVFSGNMNFGVDTVISEVHSGYREVQFTGTTNNIASGVRVDFEGDGTYLTSTFFIGGLTGDGEVAVAAAEIDFGANPLFDGDISIGSDGFINTPVGTQLGTAVGNTVIEQGGVLRNGLVGSWSSAENFVFEGSGNVTGSYGAGVIYNEGDDMTFTGDVTISDISTFYNEADTETINFAGGLAGTSDIYFMGDTTNGGYEITGTASSTYSGTMQIYGSSINFNKSGGLGTAGNVRVEATLGVPALITIQNGAGNQIADNATVEIINGTVHDATFGSSKPDEVIGSLTGNGNIYVTGAGQGFAVGGGNVSGLFAGEFVNTTPSAITKTGTGTWDISGATYTGVAGQGPTINVFSGTVLWGNNLSEVNIAVGNGGVLKGTGTAGTVTVNNLGSINVGNSPGCMTIGTLNLNNGGTFIAELASATPCTGYDQTTVSGTANISGANLTISPTFTPTDGTTFTILTAGTVTGTFNGLVNGATVTVSGMQFRINYTATAVTLTKLAGTNTSTPTPGTSLSNTGTSGLLSIFAGMMTMSLAAVSMRKRFMTLD